ncbi:glycosyltransferase family 2 protein [bacterium]|nr:glycosyltransferase family 2 protein [bacterium]
MKKVSIIITCYNKAKFIKECLDSALNQTYPDIEIVVYNDASKDDSAKIIQKYADENDNIIFINALKNRGVSYARNKAVEICTGEYIFPLDGDDYIDLTYIEKAVMEFERDNSLNVVSANSYSVRDNGIFEHKSIMTESYAYHGSFAVSALMRKSDFYRAGGYKEYMTENAEDAEFWLSCIELGFKFKIIDEYLLYVRRTSDNKDRRNLSRKFNHKKSDKCKLMMMKNHMELFRQDNQIVLDYIDVVQKFWKYKELYILFLAISIFEFCLIVSIHFVK